MIFLAKPKALQLLGMPIWMGSTDGLFSSNIHPVPFDYFFRCRIHNLND
jgi:hypothetical protein